MPLAVLSVSTASLLTALHAEKSMEALVEQNSRLVHAQSTPLLAFDTGNYEAGKHVLSMTIANVGTGPAEVYWLHISDEQGVDSRGAALTDRALKAAPHSSPSSEQVESILMRSGEERSVFKWPRPNGSRAGVAEWEKLEKQRVHLSLSACYCSMFDECRITDFGVSRPKPVTSCEQGDRSS